MNRRGMSLIELLLAVTMLGLLAAMTAPLLRGVTQAAHQAGRRLAVERDATAFAALLDHDLRHAAASDVGAPAATILEHDRPVGEAPVCGLLLGAPLVRTADWRGWRLAAVARDAMHVLVVPEPTHWQRRVITALTSANCPDGTPAIRLEPDLPLTGAEWIRVVEPVRLRRYASSGREWLGLEHRWNGTSIQPLAGPVLPGGVQWILHPAELFASLGHGGGVAVALRLPLE